MTTANDDLKEAVNAEIQAYLHTTMVQFGGQQGAAWAIAEGALWAWCAAVWKGRVEGMTTDEMALQVGLMARDNLKQIESWDAQRRGAAAPPPGVTIQ